MIAMRIRIISRSIVLAAAILGLLSSASAQWKEKVLYSFQGGTDGALPAGGLIHDKLGNLYGMTTEGGSTSCPPGWCGTVYKLSPPAQTGAAWTETLVYVFKGHDQNDGSSPSGNLIADSAGNLYGVTGYGGSGPCVLFGTATGCGTVFELSPPITPGSPWTETVLYSFQGGNDGDLPTGSLVFDKAGNLYGATEFGGGQGTSCDAFYGGNCGTIFELIRPQNGGLWAEKVLHGFGGGTDGAVPNGGLALDVRGAVYGTTYYGGTETGTCNGGLGGSGCGTVFRLIPPSERRKAWTEKILFRFSGQDGAGPAAGVTFDRNGNLYGTTYAGAIGGNGEVFELNKPSGGVNTWEESVLYRFTNGTDGSNPMANLVFDLDGNLYGTTDRGGYTSQYGTVFQIAPQAGSGWTLNVLYGFGPGVNVAGQPASSLIPEKHAALIGTTQFGGTGQTCQGGCGTVFGTGP